MTSSPPMRTSSIVTTVPSGLNVRLASLYGSVIRSTSCTPSMTRINAGSTLCAPTTPRTVRLTPVERCTSMPCSTRLRDDLFDLRLGRPLFHHNYHDYLSSTFPVGAR